jgi:hypothetical protein
MKGESVVVHLFAPAGYTFRDQIAQNPTYIRIKKSLMVCAKGRHTLLHEKGGEFISD